MGQPYTRLIVLIAINAATVCPQTSTKINTCSKGENVSSNIERNSEIERLTLEKKTRKDRAEEWDKYNIAFIFLAGFAAVGLVITGIGVSRSNGALNKSSEELSHAKDLRAEEEIAAVNCLAGDANERAAEANRTAEQEKLARVRLEERFAWRRINPKEHDALVALLKPHAGALVELRQHGEIEAATF